MIHFHLENGEDPNVEQVNFMLILKMNDNEKCYQKHKNRSKQNKVLLFNICAENRSFCFEIEERRKKKRIVMRRKKEKIGI